MSRDLAEFAIQDAIYENEHLRGDDCKSSRQFLLGWAGGNFKKQAGRMPDEEEEEVMVRAINQFLDTNVERMMLVLDKVINVFVVADQDLADSTCECCKAKRELLKELKANYLVK